MLKKRILLFLRLFAGATLFGITFYLVDWRSVLAVIADSRIEWIGAAALILLLTLGLKLARWVSLLRGYGVDTGWIVLGRAFFSGQAANILLPVRGGEMLRLGIAAAQNPEQWSILAASITLEKILDFFALLSMSVWVWNNQPGKMLLGQSRIPWINALLVVLLLALIPAWKFSRPWLVKSAARAVQQAVHTIDRVTQYLRWISYPRRLLSYAGSTAVIWGLMVLTNLCVMRSVSLPANAAASGAVLVLVYVGIAPALMPGNLGPFLVFASLGLTAYGYPPELAFAFAVLLHLIVTIPPLLLSASLYLAGQQR